MHLADDPVRAPRQRRTRDKSRNDTPTSPNVDRNQNLRGEPIVGRDPRVEHLSHLQVIARLSMHEAGRVGSTRCVRLSAEEYKTHNDSFSE